MTDIVQISDIETQKVHKVYEIISDTFNSKRFQHWTWINEFMDSLPSKSTILDLGCGSGRNMIGYEDHNFIGLDMCSNFVNICKSKGLNAIEGDICNLPFEDETFDSLICIAVFHHLSTNERRNKCLSEIHRVVKKNKRILLSVWSIEQPKKTRREFKEYGDTIVNWVEKGKTNEKIYERYYYIFQIIEIINLFKKNNFEIISHKWDCGNEVFILEPIK